MPRSTRSRQSGMLVNLFSSQTEGTGEGNPLYLRQIKLADALAMVEERKAAFVYGSPGRRVGVTGIRLLALNMSDRTSPATLTLASSKAASGEGLKKPHEISGRHLEAREQAEREKLMVWPLIGDTKAVAVRPRISDEDRRRAENVLRCA